MKKIVIYINIIKRLKVLVYKFYNGNYGKEWVSFKRSKRD